MAEPTTSSTGAPSAVASPCAPVVPLNDAAAVYDALAREIEGTAVGWSDPLLARLEGELLARYGTAVGGRAPIRRLVRLAARPCAA